MRYVMAFFVCSTKGCEARTERLVSVTRFGSYVTIDHQELPDGWSSERPNDRPIFELPPLADQERTYCPDCKRKPDERTG